MSVLQRLHDSEIAAGIQALYDQSWVAWVGTWPRHRALKRGLPDLAACERWLDQKARELYPDSEYTRSVTPAPP